MVKKITVKEDVYEKVLSKVGEREKVVYMTSDGKEFDAETSADYHEFYVLKVKKRGFGSDYVNIFDFESWEDVQKYLNEYGYNIDVHDYNKEDLKFPNTYVLSEEYVENLDYGYDEYGQPEKHDIYLRIYEFDEFKSKLVSELEKLRNI